MCARRHDVINERAVGRILADRRLWGRVFRLIPAGPGPDGIAPLEQPRACARIGGEFAQR